MNVLDVKPHPKNAEWRVVTTDRGDYIVFAGKLADQLDKGKPLPQGTSEEPPKFEGGLPSLRLPRPGGGGPTAYRNTKEAFEAEAASRLAWQQVEEERKDRRTALMTAVEWLGNADMFGTTAGNPITDMANHFYRWLRSSPAVSEPAAERGVASKGESAGGSDSSLAGDTSSGEREGPDTSVDSGEVSADTKPGEGQPKPSPGFPMSPEECSHKGASGRWLPTKVIDGLARCPRCGESAVIYMETA